MFSLNRITALANKLDIEQFYCEADMLDGLIRLAYDKDDERVVEFINKYGDTSRGEQMEDIMWVALERGIPDVYRAIDKNLDFDTLWRAIKEMTEAKEKEEAAKAARPNPSDFMNPL